MAFFYSLWAYSYKSKVYSSIMRGKYFGKLGGTKMKKLIFINGTMGVGKTTTCKELMKLLPQSVFLDGDWCWYMHPFVVTDETKAMVEDNIAYVLRNFLNCSVYQHVIFCWVMHQDTIISDLLACLEGTEYKLYKFTLSCSEQALEERLQDDVNNNIRESDIIRRSLERLKLYEKMDTTKIDVSNISAQEAAKQIAVLVSKN